MAWWWRRFGRQRSATPAPAVSTAAPVPADGPANAALPLDGTVAASPPLVLPRLIPSFHSLAVTLRRGEMRALSMLQALSDRPLSDDGLPRAAALIPQLLAMLRQPELPVPALARRVARDPVLAAEVLRRATAVGQGPDTRGEMDLAQAIQRIGEAGLQAAIARVILLPIHEAEPGGLAARCTRQPDWAASLADTTATIARSAGLPAFDGYLAGLLYGVGWSVALRAIDRSDIEPEWPPSDAFTEGLDRMAHRLFGRQASRWTITPGFQALAVEAQTVALAASTLPLAIALRQALTDQGSG